MSGESFAPQPITMFGGWVPNAAPEGLPAGMSWDCQDVDLVAGGVRTRPGLVSQFPTLAGSAYVNYLKTFPTLDGTNRLLVLDSLGNLYKENPTGTLALVISALADGALCRSETQFGREYMGFSDGKVGIDLPRQFDDTNFDRVSQVGPGAGPAVADANIGIQSIVRSGGVVTVILQTGSPIQVGDSVTVAGVAYGGATAFNGTFTVATVPTSGVIYPGAKFTYAQAGEDAAGTGGTVTPAGNISAGKHQVSVSFVTRQGYWTRPAPPVTWTAAGNLMAQLTNIPVGQSNVVARIVMFTPAGQTGGPSFYHIAPGTGIPAASAMLIDDNTTTTAIFDFTDADLIAAESVGYLFDLVELPEQAGVIAYQDRLFWWGERTGIWSASNGVWLNLTFDGGWSGNVPLGWTLDPTSGAGGSKESTLAAWGDAYRITGDGATAIRGKITQSAYEDDNGVGLISARKGYSVRARVRAGGGLAAGTLHVNLQSTADSLVTAGLAVTAAQAPTTGYAEFVADLTDPLAVVPSDLVLQVYADGTPTNGGYFIIDNIEIYETDLGELAGSILRASRVNDPESYDGVQGLMNVAPSDGQRITNAFVLRNNLYIVKERSLYVTADDGVNEPALWEIQQVSNRVGTPSIHGVAMGDQAAVIAGQDGVYVFDGSPPQKISQEIQSDQRGMQTGTGAAWDQINWGAGETLWTALQNDRKRLLVGVPIGAATRPSWTLAMQFAYGSESLVEVTRFRLFRDAPLARGWAPWTIAANSAALIARPDGSFPLFLGSNDGTGKIRALTEGTYDDDGALIPAYYATYFANGSDLGLPPVGRKLFGYLRANAEGQGKLVVAGLPTPDRTMVISAVSRAGNLATLTTSKPHGFFAGQLVDVEGVADASFNGQISILTVPSAIEFTFKSVGANGASSGGSALPLVGVWNLANPGSFSGNLELPVNISGEALALRFAIDKTGNAGDWFSLRQRVELYLKLDPWAPFGTN